MRFLYSFLLLLIFASAFSQDTLHTIPKSNAIYVEGLGSGFATYHITYERIKPSNDGKYSAFSLGLQYLGNSVFSIHPNISGFRRKWKGPNSYLESGIGATVFFNKGAVEMSSWAIPSIIDIKNQRMASF